MDWLSDLALPMATGPAGDDGIKMTVFLTVYLKITEFFTFISSRLESQFDSPPRIQSSLKKSLNPRFGGFFMPFLSSNVQ